MSMQGWFERQLQVRLDNMSGKTAPRPTPVRRPLHRGDVDGWLAAAEQRDPPRKRDRETLRNYLMSKNPRRWKALQRHLRWVESEMLSLGVNPEDARWLL